MTDQSFPAYSLLPGEGARGEQEPQGAEWRYGPWANGQAQGNQAGLDLQSNLVSVSSLQASSVTRSDN